MTAIYFDSPLDDDARRQKLYEGGLFIYSPTPSAERLTKLARDMLEEAFAPHDPRTIHEHLDAEEVAAILSKLKPQFIHHPECKALIPGIMRERGVDLDKLYFDVPRMRSAYPKDFLSAGIAYAFHPHRDTWYSAPTCQLNWWLPIYPIEPENSMAFYPRYFDEAVANNSEIYNYYEWNTKARATAASQVKTDTREQPKPQQNLEQVKVTVLPQPSGLIIFSGAQLHETVPNTTPVARYSIDFRTVHIDDVSAHRGAVNVDARCTGTTMRDYVRASDKQGLPDDLIKTYDDGTEAVGNRILRYGGPARA